MSENAPEITPTAEAPKRSNPLVFVILAVLALAGVAKGYSVYSFGQTHVDTEDAYVTGDLVNISPTVSGTLVQMAVQDGQFVHKGDVIAKLDSSGPEADVAQAQANLRAAETQVPQAKASFEFAKLSTDAAIASSRAAVDAQNARTSGARLQGSLTESTVENQILQAASQVKVAEGQAAQAEASVETARAACAAAQQAIVTADRQADAAQAGVTAARAAAERAEKDRGRFEKLLASDAVTRQQYDAISAAATAATAQLRGAQEQAAAVRSAAQQARAGLSQAKAQLVAVQRQADAAKSQVQAAKAAHAIATANRANVEISAANTSSMEGMGGQANAGVATAEAGSQNVTLRAKQIATAEAQSDQAKAALDRAKIRLRDCTLIAPCDGYVVKRTVNVGTAVNPGQTVVTITRGTDVWVMGNFKETQLEKVREGQAVEYEVDAYSGAKFHGKVLSILRATGSATTLIPPDNSTGNFTKVVQRVPIKLSIEGDGAAAQVLRQGMSVTAVIDTSSKGSE